MGGLPAGNHEDFPKDGAESRITEKQGECCQLGHRPPEMLSEHWGGELENGQLEPMAGIWSVNYLCPGENCHLDIKRDCHQRGSCRESRCAHLMRGLRERRVWQQRKMGTGWN